MTIEATLTHGLQTSAYGSEYKAEYDANLALLDPDRITSGPLASRPPAGTARRFYFATDQNTFFFDNGATWVQQTAPTTAAHAATHASGGGDALTLAQSQVTNLTADLAAKEASANKGAANGYAPLDATSKVPVANIPALAESQITNLTANLAAKEASANKGAANGYAPLDATSKIPAANLPSSLIGSSSGNIMRWFELAILRDTSGANGITCQIRSAGGRSFNTTGHFDGTVSAIFGKGGNATVGSGATAVTYSLGADGRSLTLDFVEVISNVFVIPFYNASGTAFTIFPDIISGNLIIYFYVSPTAGAFDLTSMTNGGQFNLQAQIIVGGAA